MTPKNNPRDIKPPAGADFDLERILARYQLQISQIKFDLPPVDALEKLERPSAPPLELPPPPKKKSYFDDSAAAPAPPPVSTPLPRKPEAGPQLGLIEAPQRPPEPAPAQEAPATSRTPPKRWRRVLFLSAAAAMVPIFFLIWKGGGSQARSAHASFPLPLGRMMGLVVRDGTLLTVDTDKQALVTMAADTGRIVSREKFPNPSLRGFTWGQGSFWSSDLESGFIYQHGPAEPHSLINAFPTSRSISVLHHDGQTLWASDVRSEIVHRYFLTGKAPDEKLSRQGEYPLPGIVVGGFYQADGVLWILDSLSRKVRRYRLGSGGKLSLLDTIDLSPWLATNSEIAGFTVDASSLWLITDNPASLHRFDLPGLSWTQEKAATPPGLH
jgi:hypothetical protein